MANIHALLIGIDFYEPNPYFNSLQGAVRDIKKVASYLENSRKISPKLITRLTSPLPKTNSTADARSACEELPTYENIVKAFNRVTEQAEPQDIVYIHYSGHGGRVKTIFPDLKGEGQYDEGLVPMDVGYKGRYLRDVEMATLLKRMTDKGLIVTVIFDSCHSGGATRGDSQIRGSRDGEPDTQDRLTDSTVATKDELEKNWLTLTQNDQKESWLPNQKDYVFIGACRPSEYAYEAAFDGKDRNGALTYWMIDTLVNSKSALTYQSLYNRIKGMIQSKFPQQLPILLGEGDRLVFEDKEQPQPYTLTITDVTEDQKEVTLDAGISAGLSPGARLAIYSSSMAVSDKMQQLAICELTDQMQADKSTARILSVDQGGVKVKGKIEPGAVAIMVAAPVNLIRKVRLFAQKQAGEKEQDLPVNLVDKQIEALEKIRQALKGNGWVIEVKEGEESHFQVAVGKDGEYEICIGMPIKNLHPHLKIEDPDSPQKVVDRLVHLVKYQAVQELDNPASELTKYLQFELCDKNKQPFADPQNVSLKQEEVSYLKIKNNYSQILNISVLDIEPTWEISLVPIQGEMTSFFSLDPQQETLTKLRLKLPPNYQETKEILKIFATKGLANFQWLTLPSLDEQPQTKGLNQQLITRGLNRSINPLNNLLTAIGGDVNNPPLLTRAFVYESDPEAEWVTKDIVITVKP